MKTTKGNGKVPIHLNFGVAVRGALTMVMLLQLASAQEGTVVSNAAPTATESKPAIASTPTTTTAGQAKAAEPRQGSTETPSAEIEGILKMADAGVSKEVIRTYIESAPIAISPTVTDLILLKERGVADDITTALLKRSAEVKAQDRRVRESAAIRSYAVGQPASFDPESYDFWWYHYAYPRTLSAMYERMSPYYGRYSYNYAQPFLYGPNPMWHSYPRYSGFVRRFPR